MPLGKLLCPNYPLQPNLGSFSSVITVGHLSEPFVVQGLLGRNTLSGVVYKDFLEQVSKVLQEIVTLRNHVLFRSALVIDSV